MSQAPPLPLAGARILSLEQYGAGPYGTMMLAQLGAEVIKLEPPHRPGRDGKPSGGGDSARATGPYYLGEDDSLFYQTFNYNKRSLTLDLRSPEGQTILHRLVATADAITNNARGDQPAKLGLTHAALAPHNPAIVCVHASAYGRNNPRETWPGYDYLAQAEAGFLSVTGEPDAPPTRFGLSMVDFMTGQLLATTTLAGIIGARATGEGRDYDLSLLDTALHQTSYPATWYLNEGHVVGRSPRASHPYVTPSQLFRTADGWILVMAQLPKFWERLADTIGAAHLTTDPRFATTAARLEHRDTLTELLDAIFTGAPTAHWVERLGGICPVAPVHDLAQALDSPLHSMVQAIPHPARPDMRGLANPILMDGERLPATHAPALGADTDAILADAGFTAADIAGFRDRRVI